MTSEITLRGEATTTSGLKEKALWRTVGWDYQGSDSKRQYKWSERCFWGDQKPADYHSHQHDWGCFEGNAGNSAAKNRAGDLERRNIRNTNDKYTRMIVEGDRIMEQEIFKIKWQTFASMLYWNHHTEQRLKFIPIRAFRNICPWDRRTSSNKVYPKGTP